MAYARSVGCDFYEVSAKADLNVGAVFVAAAKRGLEYHQSKQASVPAYMGGRAGNGNGNGNGAMRNYVPPQRTVDLHRGDTDISDGECC